MEGQQWHEDLGWYLATYRDFPRHEKEALRHVRGRVLDLGCGAGRHALYLQRRGLRVIAVDAAPRAVELTRLRGVEDARVADLCRRLPFAAGQFDTVLLFGNNLGLCGTVRRFRRVLRELCRVTSRRGRIVGSTRAEAPVRLSGRVRRREGGPGAQASPGGFLRKRPSSHSARPSPGSIRLRLVWNGQKGDWFDLLLFDPWELADIAAEEGWGLAHLIPLRSFGEGYAVVLDKQ